MLQTCLDQEVSSRPPATTGLAALWCAGWLLVGVPIVSGSFHSWRCDVLLLGISHAHYRHPHQGRRNALRRLIWTPQITKPQLRLHRHPVSRSVMHPRPEALQPGSKRSLNRVMMAPSQPHMVCYLIIILHNLLPTYYSFGQEVYHDGSPESYLAVQ